MIESLRMHRLALPRYTYVPSSRDGTMRHPQTEGHHVLVAQSRVGPGYLYTGVAKTLFQIE